jgi:hypothetical protein
MAWQSKLFFFSCVTRAGYMPITIVHELGENLRTEFVDIARAGGVIKAAPNYRITKHGDDYPPRNNPGTLLRVAGMNFSPDDLLVICDPDMIFLRRPKFPERLSANFYAYVKYNRLRIYEAGRRIGVSDSDITNLAGGLRCGAPYVIPARCARLLAETWFEAIDAFTPRNWIDSMYAFGLAIIKLRLDVKIFKMVSLNKASSAKSRGDIIHYGFGDAVWTKRDYATDEEIAGLWNISIQAENNTVLAEILAQIREAKSFYHFRW